MWVSPYALVLTGVVSDCVPAHRFHTRFSLAARYSKTNNIGVIPCRVSEQPAKCENLALSSVFCTLFASIFPLHVEATAPGPLLLYPVSFPSCSSLSCYFFPFFFQFVSSNMKLSLAGPWRHLQWSYLYQI